MVATLEQLHQDITNLKKTTAEIAIELRQLLMEYMTVLGPSVQKQLIFSSFHLCTQVHPENFLKLCVSDRETLQKKVRDLGHQKIDAFADLQRPFQDIEFNNELDPTRLLDVWETIEETIVEVLQDASRQINQFLQDAGVMQVKGLEQLLEMANKANEAGRTITNPPHLLKALVDPKDKEEEELDPVVVIYLQLGDLEFTDPSLMSWRQKLRPLLQKLSQVQQTYAQKHEEQLSAEATAAWKATWTSEDSTQGY